MSQFVTDTHAFYWYVAGDSRLSLTVHRIFQETDAGLHQILVPGIVLIEMVYLIEKGRLNVVYFDRIMNLLNVVSGSYTVALLDQQTIEAFRQIPRSSVPEMPDRIITATAYQFGLPLITRDTAIQNAGIVSTIW
jgi:PIN domain nuclease of toxin-antitoxin system